MNAEVARNAVGALDKLLSDARRALREIGAQIFGYGLEGGWYEYPEAVLEDRLSKLHDLLLIVLEAAELPGVRASVIEAWEGFVSQKKGLLYQECDSEFESCTNPALTFLERVVEGLRITVTDEISSEEAWTLNRLEAMLRDTAGLVHRREAHPEDELELQEIMHDYLSACFPDFRHNPDIGGTLKNFKPDCGIASVRAAVEFKIVHSKEQVATAFSGVSEDTASYKGSRDWTRFYAVVYQAEPFMLESHLRSDLKRIGAATWTPVVVNGPTKPKVKKGSKAKQTPK